MFQLTETEWSDLQLQMVSSESKNNLKPRIATSSLGEKGKLPLQQMANLFHQTKQNIRFHINNCFKEKELNSNSVVKESLTTVKDGKKYNTKYYNLEVIISVGGQWIIIN